MKSVITNVTSWWRQRRVLTICSYALLLVTNRLSAQMPTYADSLDGLLSQYAQTFPASRLYLHLDKSIYTVNETIWFSAYLYNAAPDSFNHQLLFAKLVREQDDSLVRSAIFSIEQNTSAGQLLLPTVLVPGNYKLLAYTDQLNNGHPVVVFRQRVQIKSDAQPSFAFQVELLDSAKQPADSFVVLLKAKRPNGLPLGDTTFRAEITAATKRLLKKDLLLDYRGELRLTLPRSPVSMQFKGQFVSKDSKETVQLQVPQPLGRPLVGFFPEGGSLIDNTIARMAIEVTTPAGQPTVCDVQLVRNGDLLSTVQTNAYGVALFTFPVRLNDDYTVKIKQTDTEFTYPLPAVLHKGAVIQIRNGIVGDTINLLLQQKDLSPPLRLYIHNFKTLVWAAEIKAFADQVRLAIPTSEMPTGVYALTLTTDANEPLSERLVFIRHDNSLLEVHTDKNTYGTKQKIGITVSTLPDSHPQLENLSLSCVAISRISFEDYPDIFTGLFIKDQLEVSAGSALCFLQGDKDRLNEILLTRGWRNYRWDSLRQTGPFLAVSTSLHPGRGKVIAKRKGIHDLVVFSDSGLFPYSTDSLGNYKLELESMLTSKDQNVFLAPVKESSQKLTLLPDTTFLGIDSRAAMLPLPEPFFTKPYIATNTSLIAPSTGGKTMETVVVTTRKPTATFKSLTCHDWVCQYNILNCRNHPFGGVPEEGQTYLYREQNGREPLPVVYIGCQSVSMLIPKGFVALPKISIAKEFYKPVYENPETLAPEYLTTLYWKAHLPMKAHQFEDFFYSSDTKGRFFCMVQGLVDGRPVTATGYFEVK